MAVMQSNTEAVLVAIPMVAFLIAGFFRLDEIFSRAPKPAERGHQLSNWDEHGHAECVEPDGKRCKVKSKGALNRFGIEKKGRFMK